MKKSEIYRLAQLAVMKDNWMSNEFKLEIIRELQDREGTALFVEDREEKENAENRE